MATEPLLYIVTVNTMILSNNRTKSNKKVWIVLREQCNQWIFSENSRKIQVHHDNENENDDDDDGQKEQYEINTCVTSNTNQNNKMRR